MLSKCVHVQAESEGEKHIANVLRSKFDATEIAVRDVSGLWCLLTLSAPNTAYSYDVLLTSLNLPSYFPFTQFGVYKHTVDL